MNESKSDKRRMKMRKIIPFPVWRIEELEKKLEEYEEKGYRVKKQDAYSFLNLKKPLPKEPIALSRTAFPKTLTVIKIWLEEAELTVGFVILRL